MIGNKNIQRGLMAVLMAVAMVFPLAGCENEADADDVEGGSDCIDVRGDFAVDECRIELHDGRAVTCIRFNVYKGGNEIMEHELIPVYTKFTGNGVRVQNDSKLIDYLDDGWKIINVTAANPLALDNNEAVVLYVIERTTASLEQTE